MDFLCHRVEGQANHVIIPREMDISGLQDPLWTDDGELEEENIHQSSFSELSISKQVSHFAKNNISRVTGFQVCPIRIMTITMTSRVHDYTRKRSFKELFTKLSNLCQTEINYFPSLPWLTFHQSKTGQSPCQIDLISLEVLSNFSVPSK